MKLHHLSASSGKMFESCEAQWSARYVTGGADVGNDAAALGTACHAALEALFAETKWDDPECWTKLLDHFDLAYAEAMSDPSHHEEGVGILRNWFNQQDAQMWDGRNILSLEERLEMDLETKHGVIPFVYIIDRLDQMDDGDLEVVDYKSGRWQLNHKQLRNDLQARSYATAIWRRFPDRSMYWVTFDYLRDNPVGIGLRPAECEAHYDYLVALAERIIESEGRQETINSGCRFCMRKTQCKTIAKYEKVDGTLTDEPDKLIARRSELMHVQKAVETMMKEIDTAVEAELEGSDDLELVGADGTVVSVSSSRRRSVDSSRVLKVIGTEASADYVKFGVGELQKLIAAADDEDAIELKKAISWTNTRLALKYKSAE